MGVRNAVSAFLVRTVDALHRHNGVRLVPKAGAAAGEPYDQDGLYTTANHEWMADPEFRRAYERGVKATGWDYRIHWRVHMALWVAATAARIPGDFVECGVGRGMMSSAVLESIDWHSLGKHFWLVDSFLPYKVADATGAQTEASGASDYYAESLDVVRQNFSEWPRVEFVQGFIPEVLASLEHLEVAYLHVDLNAAEAERHVYEFFWPRLVPGALVLLDDYGFVDCGAQKAVADEFAASKGIKVASLATGQGLMIKA